MTFWVYNTLNNATTMANVAKDLLCKSNIKF